MQFTRHPLQALTKMLPGLEPVLRPNVMPRLAPRLASLRRRASARQCRVAADTQHHARRTSDVARTTLRTPRMASRSTCPAPDSGSISRPLTCTFETWRTWPRFLLARPISYDQNVWLLTESGSLPSCSSAESRLAPARLIDQTTLSPWVSFRACRPLRPGAMVTAAEPRH